MSLNGPVDNDDTMYQICGTQMLRMSEVWKSKLRAPGGASSKLMSELQFLGQLVMSKEEKEKFLPLPLKSTERCGHIFLNCAFFHSYKELLLKSRQRLLMIHLNVMVKISSS